MISEEMFKTKTLIKVISRLEKMCFENQSPDRNTHNFGCVTNIIC